MAFDKWTVVDDSAPDLVRDIAEVWEPQSRFAVFYGRDNRLFCLAAKGGWKSGQPKMWIELPFTD